MENSENQKNPDTSGASIDSTSTMDSILETQEDSITTEKQEESLQLVEGNETPQSDYNTKIEELQALNEKYLRLYAEFENYKRRAQRDQGETARFANERLLKDFLPTVDNLERAIQCGESQTSGDGLLEGVKLTYKQFLDTLTKLGVRQITSIGESFDPTKHQAVAQVESLTVEPNSIVEEFQKGYFLYERILRPAMVTVAANQSGSDPIPTDETHRHDEGEEA
ncbi:MAG: nucleotide exchange factor GrpE [Nitrospirales bacterium]|nr:nucleotide exchange factor GrpE [Nitrospirales bacterium]